MAAHHVSFPLMRASFLEYEMHVWGYLTERCSIYCVDVGGPWWYRQWTRLHGLTQVSGAVWRRGGVDGKSDEAYADFLL
jgi:hypothetical protein